MAAQAEPEFLVEGNVVYASRGGVSGQESRVRAMAKSGAGSTSLERRLEAVEHRFPDGGSWPIVYAEGEAMRKVACRLSLGLRAALWSRRLAFGAPWAGCAF